ncbi:MAG: peroxiredoxin [Acidobacteria bacterium SCN 69-37]|nr:MAG: peroxiredoxin [Acidobacteria bacterium SCN 69-37]
MKSSYAVTVDWARAGASFSDGRYSRAHPWQFDGGTDVSDAFSPHIVPLPFSVEAAVDPEEAVVAALASCHMLWFLSVAARKGFVADSYRDEATGTLAVDPEGRLAMTEVVLRPCVAFSGEKRPTATEHDAMHHEAHAQCFIANSVRTTVRCDARVVAREDASAD